MRRTFYCESWTGRHRGEGGGDLRVGHCLGGGVGNEGFWSAGGKKGGKDDGRVINDSDEVISWKVDS